MTPIQFRCVLAKTTRVAEREVDSAAICADGSDGRHRMRHANRPAPSPVRRHTPTPTSLIPSTPATAQDLSVGIGAAVEVHRYDASNECGVFGATSTMIGGHNCYVVVQVTNVTSSPVNFVPADIRMVDQNGVGYTIEPVYPACYDSVDVNAPVGLRPHASTTVQLCYPVQTGALPQKLLGTASLTGLSFVVPPNAIVGTWGGS